MKPSAVVIVSVYLAVLLLLMARSEVAGDRGQPAQGMQRATLTVQYKQTMSHNAGTSADGYTDNSEWTLNAKVIMQVPDLDYSKMADFYFEYDDGTDPSRIGSNVSGVRLVSFTGQAGYTYSFSSRKTNDEYLCPNGRGGLGEKSSATTKEGHGSIQPGPGRGTSFAIATEDGKTFNVGVSAGPITVIGQSTHSDPCGTQTDSSAHATIII
ncbi:MAG: hypothetical protein HY203_09730 [Nitrospirae bacterium]|nr:hypothetical protein [Nitrospirota bacterium]